MQHARFIRHLVRSHLHLVALQVAHLVGEQEVEGLHGRLVHRVLVLLEGRARPDGAGSDYLVPPVSTKQSQRCRQRSGGVAGAGARLGLLVGISLGALEGAIEGIAVGADRGSLDGTALGSELGWLLGGEHDGELLGISVSIATDGATVGGRLEAIKLGACDRAAKLGCVVEDAAVGDKVVVVVEADEGAEVGKPELNTGEESVVGGTEGALVKVVRWVGSIVGSTVGSIDGSQEIVVKVGCRVEPTEVKTG